MPFRCGAWQCEFHGLRIEARSYPSSIRVLSQSFVALVPTSIKDETVSP
jgi:hypothetical protein